MKVFIILMVFFLVLGIGIFFLLQSEGMVEKFLPRWINHHVESITVKELKVHRLDFDFPSDLTVESIQLIIDYEKESFSISLDQLRIERLTHLVFSPHTLKFVINGLSVQSEDFNLKNVDTIIEVFFEDDRFKNISGVLKISEGDIRNCYFSDLYTIITGDTENITFNDVEADFYNGNIQGKIVLEYDDILVYNIFLLFEEIDLVRLRDFNSTLFSKVKGRMNGDFAMSGDVVNMRSLKAQFNISKGGYLKAVLLAPLLDYIPKSTQRRKLQQLMGTNADIPIETAKFSLESISEDRFESSVDLESQQFNLDVDLKLDINVEGGFKNLINSLDNFIF